MGFLGKKWRYRSHFFFSHGNGPRLFGDYNQISKSVFLLHNGQISSPTFSPWRDIVVPPNLNFYFTPIWSSHPQPLTIKPKRLAIFGGTIHGCDSDPLKPSCYSRGVRQYLKRHFNNSENIVIGPTRWDSYHEDLTQSVFCLCPEEQERLDT
eukprot:TRINITY_DN2434_c0_g1_i2.p1 TRINITY_DN2434_c0_g1~~TRINITY_DN2434_c0_g1_i2.p1  ORF type:complete len:152 (+),score=12.94 TRINITY_DN2434_c0_g1_i2:122-577(+)